MHPRIHGSIRPILQLYKTRAEQQCLDLIDAFYIVGSIALDGYNERFSDIDFVAVLNRRVTSTDLDSLRSLHATVQTEFPTSKLSGSYLQRDELGNFEDEIQPHPYYQDAKFHSEGYFEINSITWWILKNHGIALWGEKPADLSFTVDGDRLITSMGENLNSYWQGWTQRPRALLIMLSDWGIQWTVLGVLRQYYTFQEHSIVTKLAAARYALNRLPVRWRPLIQEAIDIREGNGRRQYRSKILRMTDTVKFLKYVIQLCNDTFLKRKAA